MPRAQDGVLHGTEVGVRIHDDGHAVGALDAPAGLARYEYGTAHGASLLVRWAAGERSSWAPVPCSFRDCPRLRASKALLRACPRLSGLEELFVKALDVQRLLDAATYPVADHQSGELFAVYQDDALAQALDSLDRARRER